MQRHASMYGVSKVHASQARSKTRL